jgi:hypothetical protein
MYGAIPPATVVAFVNLGTGIGAGAQPQQQRPSMFISTPSTLAGQAGKIPLRVPPWKIPAH